MAAHGSAIVVDLVVVVVDVVVDVDVDVVVDVVVVVRVFGGNKFFPFVNGILLKTSPADETFITSSSFFQLGVFKAPIRSTTATSTVDG